MKKRLGFIALLLTLVMVFTALPGGLIAFADSTRTYTNATEIYTYVRDGYNQGSQGPISITKGTLKSGFSSKTVYLVTLSGTELVLNQSTGVLTDLLSGFNLNNVYYANVVQHHQGQRPQERQPHHRRALSGRHDCPAGGG